jgi:hypothetical protein
VSLDVWRDLFARAPRSTLTQSYDYARAIAPTLALSPRWGVVRDGNVPVGVVQILVGGFLWNAAQVVILDRGPVWFAPPTPQRIYGFFIAFDQLFPRRLGRVRRIVPELTADQWAGSGFDTTMFRARPSIHPYQTAWVDLTVSVEALRAGLDRKWRNILVRAEGMPDLNVAPVTTPDGMADIIRHVAADQSTRRYRGPGPRLLRALVKSCAAGDGAVAVTTYENGVPIAGALFLRHGSCATWQTGWVSARGRDIGANYRVLWRGMVHLKSLGVAALDLGGYNQATPGIRHFKSGIGGVDVTLAGAFG